MSYPLRNKERNKSSFFRNLFFLVLIVVAITLVFPNFGSAFLRRALTPLWKIKETVFGSNMTGAILRSKRSLVAENKNLEEALAESRLSLLALNTLRTENEKMREALNALSGREVVWAHILARPPVSLYDTFVIDTADNVLTVGQQVLAFGNIPIGEIVESESGTALVRLYSAPGNTFQVFLGENTETVEVAGTGAGNFQVRVPKAVGAQVGQTVFLSGTRNILGTIGAVEEKSSDSFKTIYIKSPVNIYRLNAVQVLI